MLTVTVLSFARPLTSFSAHGLTITGTVLVAGIFFPTVTPSVMSLISSRIGFAV